ncbi:MAG: glutamate--tRNA ligase [Hyphomicrobiaceae bacterium]
MPNSSQTAAPVVRFAPSPTGYLHIGGARTALFNWLYAQANNGKFLLRIEDTDRQRHTPEAVAAILDGLKWLELNWDGEPDSQFANADRHRAAADQMLANGTAYKCYLSKDELDRMRATAEAEKRKFIVDSPWRNADPASAPANTPFVVRLKSPTDGVTHVNDEVQGGVTFPNADLDDLILLRSDGSPTYNLAVVVDDHDMGVTHVMRGVDHLTNAARQTQIYQALDWDLPNWAHVPLIHGPDGAKLSKRHGALGIEAYRASGFLPEALRNYLVRLGWSHGDDEIIPTKQLIEWFGFDGIGKSPARFDVAKLTDLNGHYIRNSDDHELVRRCRDLLLLPQEDVIEDPLHQLDASLASIWLAKLDAGVEAQLLASMPGLKERAKTLVGLLESAAYLFAERPLSLNKKATKLLDDDARENLKALHAHLSELDVWTTDELETAVRKFAEDNDLKLGKIAQPLRAAITGTNVSPPVFDVIAILGREEALARLKDQSA